MTCFSFLIARVSSPGLAPLKNKIARSYTHARTTSTKTCFHTSTFHWKVDGSELLPDAAERSPMAYQSDPQLQSPKHVERSYANTKLGTGVKICFPL